MQEDDREFLDPLCPNIAVMAEERKNLCKYWRKDIIIKLLGRWVGYRFLYGKLTKIWNLYWNFELIDLQNNFFMVRFAEMADYKRVMYDGLWMILGHYLKVQRWKPEFKPLEEYPLKELQYGLEFQIYL